jgi:hypothetical protein
LVQPSEAALAERWNGKRWKIQRTPSPAAALLLTNMSLSSVACTSRTVCIAVGSYTNSAYTVVALADRWNGDRWRIQDTPDPAGATSTALSGVACTSRNACTTVGSYTNSASATMALAERWDRTSWTIQSPGGGALSSVSCPSATACVAVGGSWSEIWDGSSWTLHSTPNPTSYGAGQLNSVSCTSATACTAVGSYTDTSTLPGTMTPLGIVTLAERWDGSGWMIQTTPNYEPQYGETRLEGVSCSSATVCTAVGDWGDSEHQTAPVAELWDGTNWTLQSVPTDGEAAVFDELNGVSCTSATACTAVGVLIQEAPLAETWNGTSWTIQTTPTPGGFSQFKFSGCRAPQPPRAPPSEPRTISHSSLSTSHSRDAAQSRASSTESSGHLLPRRSPPPAGPCSSSPQIEPTVRIEP